MPIGKKSYAEERKPQTSRHGRRMNKMKVYFENANANHEIGGGVN